MLSVILAEPGRFDTLDLPAPVPSADEVLVKVHRIGVCGTDLHAFAGRQPFFTYPRRLGHELGVEVVEPGPAGRAAGLVAGDRCAVEPYLNCGHCIACRRGRPNCCTSLRVLGVHTDGGMVPLMTVPAAKLHRGNALDFDQLALVETLGIGAHAVERAALEPGEYVVVIGAGPIGLGVIQFAQARGARVAVVDLSESRRAFCRDRLGVPAEDLHAPGDDLADRLRAGGGGDLPTGVFDATGNPRSMHAAFGLPAHGGRLVLVGLFPGDLSFNDPEFHRRELTLLASRNATPGTFGEVIRLIEAGRIDTRPWITHRLALAEVPEVFPRDIAGNGAVLKAMIAATA